MPTRCAHSIHISLVFKSSFSSRKQFTISSHSSQVSLFLSFIPSILKLFLLERSSKSTSFFSISLAQLGLVVWINSMSFLRPSRFLYIVVIFSFNLLNLTSVSSLLRLSSVWFVSVVFPEINCIMLFSWLLNISSCFFVIASWCCLNISWKIFLISSMVILFDPVMTFSGLMANYYFDDFLMAV